MKRADAQILISIEWSRWQLQFSQRHYVHNPEGHQENGYPERKHPPLAGRCKGYIVITQVVHVVPGGRRRRRAEGGGGKVGRVEHEPAMLEMPFAIPERAGRNAFDIRVDDALALATALAVTKGPIPDRPLDDFRVAS